MGKFLHPKTIKTELNCVTRAESINITSRDIDKLNQDIANNIAKNEIEREKGLEIAEKCVMK